MTETPGSLYGKHHLHHLKSPLNTLKRIKTFLTFLLTLVSAHKLSISLKNDMMIEGNLESVDQRLNIQLDDIDVVDTENNPYLVIHILTF